MTTYVTHREFCNKQIGRIPFRQFKCPAEQEAAYRASAQEFEEIRAARTENEAHTSGDAAQSEVFDFEHLLANTKHAPHSGVDQA
jgi:hypothetical protein